MKKWITLLLSGILLLGGSAVAQGAELAIPASCYQGSTYLGYTVQSGDTLYGIGQAHGFDARTLAAINQVTDAANLAVGQTLMIPTTHDVDYRVTGGESLSKVADLYGIDKLEIAVANDLWDTEVLPAGVRLTIPRLNVAQVSSASLSSRGSRFVPLAPVVGTLTSPYGYRGGEFHTGIDLACPVGTPVKAAETGQVVFAGWEGNYGNSVVIDHQNGYKTRYGHNSALKTTVGAFVARGEIIALSGSTGRSTGPHVHLEIIKGGQTQDPASYLSQ